VLCQQAALFGAIDHRFESEVFVNPDDFPTHLDKDVARFRCEGTGAQNQAISKIA